MTYGVYTRLQNLSDINTATWRLGSKTSSDVTMKMAAGNFDNWDRIRLSGHVIKSGVTVIDYASSDLHPGWMPVGNDHIKLATYLLSKLDIAPEPLHLGVFFDKIDDPEMQRIANRLIALECGTNVEKTTWGPLHHAVTRVLASLACLGVPTGDWCFIPLLNGFESTFVH